MLSVSAAFQAAVRHSAKIAFRADLTNLSGQVVRTLDITGGSVTVDGSAAIRRSGKVSLMDPTGTLTPTGLGELLSPVNHELRLYAGYDLPSGPEVVGLGVFRISVTDMKHTPSGISLDLNLYDRAKRIQRARFSTPVAIPAGTNYATAIGDLLRNRWPGATFINQMSVTATTPALFFPEQEDPWAHLRRMADAIGGDLAPDVNGNFVLRDPQVSLGTAAATYQTGTGSALLGVSRRLSEERTYSAVIAVGEAPGEVVVRSEAQDLDPNSPTFVNGSFGYVPYWFASPLITSQAQADAAAVGQLARVTGAIEEVGGEIASNPAHEPFDLLRIIDAQAKLDALFILDAFTIPLLGGRMPVRLRKRRTFA